MKKGYKRLLVFELLVLLILFLNSFVWNILSNHFMNIFLLFLIVIFKVFFGLEKDRHRYIKDLLMEVFIFLLIYFMLFYLFGILVTFAKPGNYYNVRGLVNFIIPSVFLVIFREYFRYNVMNKAEGSNLLTVISIVMFIFIDISSAIYYAQFTSGYNIFIFIALTLLPAVSNNLAFSYITLRVGYKPIMLYALVMSLYHYIIPIVPNPSDYVLSIINLLLPLILLYRVFNFLKMDKDEELDREYRKHHYGWLVVSCIIVVVLVYFTSGYFKYWAIAVASGSMSPTIEKGDVVIIKKVEDNYSNINIGDVLAHKVQNVTIVHRVVNKIKVDGKYYFYTKGDSNSKEDNYAIDEDAVIGVVSIRLPLIGRPTVWLNEL